jgi:hypothetical protein
MKEDADIVLEKVTKLEAARRQLSQAIRLFFFDGDELSIHTLSAAAHEILLSLGKGKGCLSIKEPTFFDKATMKKWVKVVNETQNFLKHAGRDPQAQIEYNIRQTYLFLVDGISLYEQFTGSKLPDGSVFLAWLYLNHPEFFRGEHPTIVALKSLVEKYSRFRDKVGWRTVFGKVAVEKGDITNDRSGQKTAQ